MEYLRQTQKRLIFMTTIIILCSAIESSLFADGISAIFKIASLITLNIPLALILQNKEFYNIAIILESLKLDIDIMKCIYLMLNTGNYLQYAILYLISIILQIYAIYCIKILSSLNY